MNSNPLLKVGLGVGVAMAIGLVVLGNGEDETHGLTPVEVGPELEDNGLAFDPLTDDVLEEAYGVEVDTPEDTMRRLTVETQAVREESVRLQERNEDLQDEIDRLLKMEQSIAERVDSRVKKAETAVTEQSDTLSRERDRLNKLAESLEAKLDGLNPKKKRTNGGGYDISTAGIPDGLGYDDQSGFDSRNNEVVWHMPLDATVDEKSGVLSAPDFNLSSQVTSLIPQQPSSREKSKKKEDRMIRKYTIPANSTLMGSTSMTALLGRVPVNGQVTDPYKFKVIVGPENLAANSIRLPPSVEGVIMTGIATGDMNLSCVSGKITSMTFNFADGRIVTLPEPKTVETEERDVELGWISDRHGINCVPGQLVTNAPEWLATRSGLAFAEAFAEAAARSEITVDSNFGGGFNSAVTGDTTKYAASKGMAEALNESSQWLQDRMGQSFDAVYVPPGEQVAIHITKQLELDYDPEGRMTNYEAFAANNTRALP